MDKDPKQVVESFLNDILINEKFYILMLHAIDSSYLYVSENCKQFLGLNPEDFYGKTPYDLIHPDDIEPILRRSHLELRAHRKSFYGFYRIQNANHKYVWMESIVIPVVDNKGEVDYVISLNRKSTSKIALQYNREIISFDHNVSAFTDYLQSLQQQWAHIEKNQNHFEQYSNFRHLDNQLLFIYDCQIRSIIWVSGTESVLGYNHKHLLNRPGQLMEFVHNDDRKQLQSLLNYTFDFLANQGNSLKDLFSVDFRIQTKKGNLKRLLLQITLLQENSAAGNRRLLCLASEITHFKESDQMTWKFSGPSESLFRYEEQNKEKDRISKRELEILRYLMSGKTSKEIADILFISENTVNAHRRNMLKKTGTKSSMHLLHYAIENQLI